MPRLALVLLSISFVLLFVARSVIQWARTGSTGWKAFRARPGSPAWLASASMVAGLVLAILAPMAMLGLWPAGEAFADAPRLHVVGAGIAVLGTLGAVAAQLAMGGSWRIGVDEAEVTPLVQAGLFARVRNPIFSFMLLTIVGLLLVVPNAWMTSGVVLVAIGIEVQVRCVEEPYLARAHGTDYQRYCRRVGRFVPGLGRLRPSAPGSREAGARG